MWAAVTDETMIAIVAAVAGTGGLGGIIQLGFRKLAKSNDQVVKSNDRATDALVEIAASNAVLVTKVDEMRGEMREVNAYVRKHATQPPQNKRATTLGRGGGGRAQTPAQGVRTRGGSHADGDNDD